MPPLIPLIGAVASIGSTLLGLNASKQASDAQTAATDRATAETRRQFDESRALLQPGIEAGNTARSYQLGSLGLPGGVDQQTATGAFRDSPGYKFALNTGRNQVLTSAGASGNLFSGKSLKALGQSGQGMADQQYGNWYSRLGGLSGAGGAATGQAVQAGQGSAGTLADIAMQGGDARASSYIRGANSAIGGITNLADLMAYYGPGQQQPMLPKKSLAPGGFNPNLTGQLY